MPIRSLSQEVKKTSSVGVPRTWIAPRLRSTVSEGLPTLIFAFISLTTAPASNNTVTPLGTFIDEPSARTLSCGSTPIS